MSRRQIQTAYDYVWGNKLNKTYVAIYFLTYQVQTFIFITELNNSIISININKEQVRKLTL